MFSTGRRAVRTLSAAALLALALLVGVPAAAPAPRDRQAPTAPTNLRVTGVTAYTVSLAWNASTDNSGSFVYKVRHSWGYEATVPQTQTSFTWTGNVEPRGTYSFWVYAVDAAGNKSKSSNTVSVTLLADTTPPSAPAVQVADLGPTHLTLSWSATDDGPLLWTSLWVDGVRVVSLTRENPITLYLARPERTYTILMQVRDQGGNWGPVSQALAVTTPPSDPNDQTPPTVPANLWANHWGDTEFNLHWTESTDNVTTQEYIEYYVYVNGVFSDVTVGSGFSVNYGNFGPNEVTVIAVDEAGNASEPATITVDL
jgi:chitodextrinase